MKHHRALVLALLASLTIGTASLMGQSSAIIGTTISDGYISPTSKIGIIDAVPFPALEVAFAPSRYARFVSIGTKLKHYNIYWEWLEPQAIPSSMDANLACGPSLVRVPTDASELLAKGYHKYRCLDPVWISWFDSVLQRDQQNGIESAVILYWTPPQYRHPNCRPVPTWLVGGCAPRDDAMDDFEDYVNFLASRYNGANGVGRLTHYVVWNEIQQGAWFNYDPIVPWEPAPSVQQVDTLLEKYKSMLVRAHTAIYRHVHPAMMYVSLDSVVGANSGSSNPPASYHMDTSTVLAGLWSKLGTSIDWSVAIHPYLPPAADLGGTFINYHALSALVAYQSQKLAERSISNPLNRPQATIFASEQGWDLDQFTTSVTRAQYMCQAHDISMKLPSLIGSTHNLFQGGGATGLIPVSAGWDLSAIDSPPSPEWLAYQSTSPSNWGRNNSHGCCSALGLGCVAPLTGAVDGVFFENGQWVLKGWACSPGADLPIDVHLYGNGPAWGGGVYGGAYNANLSSEPAVSGACRSAGKNFRFRIALLPEWLPYHGASLWVHGISPYGAPNDLLPGSGAYSIP